ncbi:MAG: TRAP transporter small permease [Bacteriovoracaceae bacterium]|nr:TRAP transporter small permease [Bacteroidota bacterium]
MKPILFIDSWLEKISGWMLVGLLGIMIAMAFGQVILRNFFDSSIEWGDIFLRHLVLWVGYFGAVIATGEGRHLRIEFITKLVPEKPRKIFFVVSSLFAAVMCYFLMQAAISFVQLEMESESTLILDLPGWYFIIIIPIGYAMLSFRFLIRSLNGTVQMAKGNWMTPEGHH